MSLHLIDSVSLCNEAYFLFICNAFANNVNKAFSSVLFNGVMVTQGIGQNMPVLVISQTSIVAGKEFAMAMNKYNKATVTTTDGREIDASRCVYRPKEDAEGRFTTADGQMYYRDKNGCIRKVK